MFLVDLGSKDIGKFKNSISGAMNLVNMWYEITLHSQKLLKVEHKKPETDLKTFTFLATLRPQTNHNSSISAYDCQAVTVNLTL